jgi:hypothetical protein
VASSRVSLGWSRKNLVVCSCTTDGRISNCLLISIVYLRCMVRVVHLLSSSSFTAVLARVVVRLRVVYVVS